MYNPYEQLNLSPDEILVYLRKSRTDDPLMTVEEVLAKHETILNEWVERNLSAPIPEDQKYREIVSGETIADRPEIQKLLRLIESPKIKAILTVEVQRLSRGDLEDAGKLIKLLRYTNTLVITPQKTYDLRDEYDRDIFERELKRGNEFLEYQKKIMNRGKLLSVSQGNFIGSIPPYGYNKVFVTEGKRKCPILVINEQEAQVVRMVYDMYVNEDMGRVNIAHRLNDLGIKPRKAKQWGQDGIKHILENQHYTGKVIWDFRKTVTVIEEGEVLKTRPVAKMGEYLIYNGKHEAIISEELFNKAREKQGRNHRAKPTTKVRNPFASLLYCQCGRAMSLRTYKKEGKLPRLMCDDQVHCHTGSCTYEEFEPMIINILKQCIEDFEIRIKNDNGDSIKMHEKLLKTLEKKIQDLEAKELSQWEQQSHPDPAQRMPPEIFKRLNEKLLKEKDEVKEAMCNARKSMPERIDYQEKLYKFQEALDALQDPDRPAAEKNRLLKDCIERIDYNREAPELIKNPEKKTYKNGREDGKGRRLKPNPLKSGATWTKPPIELDVKLKV